MKTGFYAYFWKNLSKISWTPSKKSWTPLQEILDPPTKKTWMGSKKSWTPSKISWTLQKTYIVVRLQYVFWCKQMNILLFQIFNVMDINNSVATNNDFWTNTNTEYYSFCSFGRIRIPNIFRNSRTIRILFVGNYSNIWGQLFEYLRANNGEKVRKWNVRLFIYQ